MEILEEQKVSKANFHCYGGKLKWALKYAEKYGWNFSIPANANKNELFQKLLQQLPAQCILTETDAPYLSPVRNTRNEPKNVVETVKIFAKLRGWTVENAKSVICDNFCQLISLVRNFLSLYNN